MIKRKIYTACTENRKEKITVVLLAVFFTLSFIGRLFFAGQSAAKNVELRELFTTKQELQQQVSRLKYDDARISAVSYVEERAKQLGFVPMTNFLLSLDITVSPPLASATLTR